MTKCVKAQKRFMAKKIENVIQTNPPKGMNKFTFIPPVFRTETAEPKNM